MNGICTKLYAKNESWPIVLVSHAGFDMRHIICFNIRKICRSFYFSWNKMRHYRCWWRPVTDGCLRHLVLMTSGVDASEMLVWWPIWNVGDWSHKIMQFEQCLKHLFLNGRRHNVRSDVRILNSDITESRLILNIPSRSPNGKKWIVIRIYFGLEYWLIQKPERLSTSETRSFSIYNYVFTQNLFHS